MRIYLAGIALIATLIAGCSADRDPVQASQSPGATGSKAPGMPMDSLSSRPATASFASLPDRGELLRYSPARRPERSGAYTFHPVDISEAHALNAIATGELRLTTPDGKPVSVTFERMEEHPEGDWTWVGRSPDDGHAVLTFGERAVFGEILAGGRTYRVLTRRGSAWLVETDYSRLAGSSRGQRSKGPDFLLPPELPARKGSDAGAGMVMAGAKAVMAQAQGIAVSPMAANAVVDVVMGYTNGLVTAYGNQSVVQTRINSLVAITNAAYERSGVNMRIRLVRTVQVNYPDNTDNADALQKLSGYDARSGQPITPDAAFNELRKARDDYGGDLVALLRPFREPEQDGCGIAWLLGAGQRPITPDDAELAYAVVSDGDDVGNDGQTYMCSDKSLAHELGHLMGQAHNQADSEYPGTHAYSYGYRESSSSGFFTIMAYPEVNGSQYEIAYFANPSVSYDGRPTGVANQSDNVRSMNQTMPIVAEFRETKVPLMGIPPRDVDGDGRSELLWRRTDANNDNFRYWKVDEQGKITKSPYFTFSRSYTLAATGDFNGDGRLDLVWANPSTGHVTVRLGNGTSFATRVDLGNALTGSWKIIGAGDVDGDGRSELLLRRTNADGDNFRYWKVNSNGNITRGPLLSFTKSYLLAATGDFNGDGFLDLVWANPNTGHVTLRLGDGTRFDKRYDLGYGYNSAGWKIAGAGDVDGDGRAELLWRRSNTDDGNFRFWRIGNNGEVTKSPYFSFAKAYVLASTGDFNGDGFLDLVWANPNTGHVTMRLGNGSSFQKKLDLGSPYSKNSNGWRITAPGP